MPRLVAGHGAESRGSLYHDGTPRFETRKATRQPFPKTLGAYLDAYIASRDDVKARTHDIFQRTRRSLVQYFGPEKRIDQITPGDAKLWRQWLFRQGRFDGGPLAENTVNDRCKKARQFFQFAVDLELIPKNPFRGLPGTVRANKPKWFFVTREMAERVLEACPDAQWRCLFALARYGGLRVPSEVLALRWSDIDWHRDRFLIHSPKTKRHTGKATRTVPIFPELRPLLEEAFASAEEGAEFVITRYRSQEANLRTQLMRIIKKAGLEPWPAVFHNLRRTRQTELQELFPAHVVCEWMGDSQLVAKDHSLQVTEDHFAQAARKALQQALRSAPEIVRTSPQPDETSRRNLMVIQEVATPCEHAQKFKYTREDSNLQPSDPKSDALSN